MDENCLPRAQDSTKSRNQIGDRTRCIKCDWHHDTTSGVLMRWRSFTIRRSAIEAGSANNDDDDAR